MIASQIDIDFEPKLDRSPTFRAGQPETVRVRSDWSAPGVRTFDAASGCFVHRLPEADFGSRPRPSVLPVNQPAGGWWEVRDGRQVMWRLRAVSLEAAIEEKARLCRSVGARPGWCRVYPLEVKQVEKAA